MFTNMSAAMYKVPYLQSFQERGKTYRRNPDPLHVTDPVMDPSNKKSWEIHVKIDQEYKNIIFKEIT